MLNISLLKKDVAADYSAPQIKTNVPTLYCGLQQETYETYL